MRGSAQPAPTGAPSGVWRRLPARGPPGGSAGDVVSLVLRSKPDHSLLGSLPTVFSRAALWRPSSVGTWTFWLLAFGTLAAFGLGVIAVVGAAESDDARN